MNTPSTPIAPSYDELHDRITEDARLLELMELLQECEAFLRQVYLPHSKDILRTADLVKQIGKVLPK